MHEGKDQEKGEDPIHESTYMLTPVLLIVYSGLHIFGIQRTIEPRQKCMYGVIGISVSVHMHVFVRGSKTYFGPQRNVRVNVKIYNLSFRYLGRGLNWL